MIHQTVVILVEDDQQRSQIAKTWAFKNNWCPVTSWQDVKQQISEAWEKIERKYPASSELRMPKTLHLRVGLRVEGKGVFYRTSLDTKMRYKAIRVYPPNHKRFDFLKLEKRIRKDLKGAMEGRFSDIPDKDQILEAFALTNPLTEIRNSMKLYQQITESLREQDTGILSLW